MFAKSFWWELCLRSDLNKIEIGLQEKKLPWPLYFVTRRIIKEWSGSCHVHWVILQWNDNCKTSGKLRSNGRSTGRSSLDMLTCTRSITFHINQEINCRLARVIYAQEKNPRLRQISNVAVITEIKFPRFSSMLWGVWNQCTKTRKSVGTTTLSYDTKKLMRFGRKLERLIKLVKKDASPPLSKDR